MATESLIIELDAKTSKLNTKLKSAEKRLDELDGTVKKTDSGLKKFSGVAGATAGILKNVAIAAGATAAAVSAIVIGSAKSRKELELLSTQAKTTAEDFQALSFATNQYGISAEQFADISKDISDKVGEFATAGTGAFQDYADVLGLTKEEAVKTAVEFQKLTSQQVISRITSDLEKAGATGAQTTFVLESLGNDLSRLSPLFAENSKELNKLTGAYKEINSELSITDAQSQQLAQLSTDFDLLTGSIGNATTKISASLAPALSEFFNGVIDVVPEATQAVVNFINTFRDESFIKSEKDLNELIDAQRDKLDKLDERLTAYKSGLGTAGRTAENTGTSIESLNRQMDEEIATYLRLEAQLRKVREEKELNRLEDAKTLKGGEISAGGGTNQTGGTAVNPFGFDAADPELLAGIIEQESINAQKLEAERSYIEAVNELRLTGQETAEELLARDVEANRLAFENKLINLDQFNQAQEAASKKYLSTRKDEVKIDGGFDKQRLAETDAYLSAASTLANTFFEDNKALRAALVVADTAAGITRQFSDLPYPAALATSAAIATSGAVQLAAISSSSKGGGGTIATPTAASVTTDTQQDFQPETDTIDFRSSTSGGSTTQTITFAADTGDSLVDAIAEALNNKMIRE